MTNEIFNTRRWNPFEYRVGGEGSGGPLIRMELKRQNPLEAAPFLRAVYQAREAAQAIAPKDRFPRLPEDATDEEREASRVRLQAYIRSVAMSRLVFFEQLPEALMGQVFERCVRNVTVSIDGEPAGGGRPLLEVADQSLLFAIVNELEELCSLTVLEGKDSASLSTSASTGATDAGVSPAPSTGGEASQAPSTATETLPPPESSIAPA
jgi:hypothetical protein